MPRNLLVLFLLILFSLHAAPGVAQQWSATDYGPFEISCNNLTVHVVNRNIGGREVASEIYIENNDKRVVFIKKLDLPDNDGEALRLGTTVDALVWNVPGNRLLVLDSKKIQPQPGWGQELDFLVWVTDFCPVGKTNKIAKPIGGKLKSLLQLRLPPGHIYKPAENALRGDRFTVITWGAEGRLLLKVPLLLKFYAPEQSRLSVDIEKDPVGGLMAIAAQPYDFDRALRGSAVLLYETPDGVRARPKLIDAQTDVTFTKAYVDDSILTLENGYWRLGGHFNRVGVRIDNAPGFIEPADVIKLGVTAP